MCRWLAKCQVRCIVRPAATSIHAALAQPRVAARNRHPSRHSVTTMPFAAFIRDDPMTVIERTHYFAHHGQAARVLAMRQRACAVRLSIELPAGEIVRRHVGGDGSEAD